MLQSSDIIHIAISICDTPIIKQIVAKPAQHSGHQRIFETLSQDLGSRPESLLIIPSSEISLKIMYFSNNKKGSIEFDSYHGEVPIGRIVLEAQLSSPALTTATEPFVELFPDPGSGDIVTKDGGLTILQPELHTIFADMKRSIEEERNTSISSLTDNVRRLESDVKSLRQLRVEGNRVSSGIQQEMELFRQQLEALEKEAQQGRSWREEMSVKLREEREEREANRAFISAILDKH